MKSKSYWQKMPVPAQLTGGDYWSVNISEIWRCDIPDIMSMVVQIRYIPISKFGEMRHLIIKKVDQRKLKLNRMSALLNSEEPSYKEKHDVLKRLGKWKSIALEVYPSESNLIDSANLYHLWEFENERVLPFSINEIFEKPEFENSICFKNTNIRYSEKSGYIGSSPIRYLYLKSEEGKNLTWYQKWRAKNEIYSSNVLAVEIISNKTIKNDYSCLICLPYNFKLGFGLRDDD